MAASSQLEDYVIQKRLAPALFGDVLLCLHRPTGDLVAVKRILLSAAATQITLTTNKKVRENVALERALYRHFNKQGGHANVLKLREEIEYDGYLYMIFDYCARGELYELVSSQADGKLDAPTTRRYMNQIARGVQYVHDNGYAHRDLSLENVLVTEEDVCQVCDFGLAATGTTLAHETVGKMFYMAPEVLAGAEYDPTKADVWSLGVMLFIMLIGAPPVETASSADARYRYIVSRGVRKLIHRWGLTDELPADAIDLIESMLQIDPARRMTMDAVVAHPFLKGRRTASVMRIGVQDWKEKQLNATSSMSLQNPSNNSSTSSMTAAVGNRIKESCIVRMWKRVLGRSSSKRVMAVTAAPVPSKTRQIFAEAA